MPSRRDGGGDPPAPWLYPRLVGAIGSALQVPAAARDRTACPRGRSKVTTNCWQSNVHHHRLTPYLPE